MTMRTFMPMPHDLRDLAPEVVLAGTVPRRGGVGVVPMCRARRLGKACARDQHCTECKDDNSTQGLDHDARIALNVG